MKAYLFRVYIDIEEEIEAASEEKAREQCMKMLGELGFSNYIVANDLELIDESDADV